MNDSAGLAVPFEGVIDEVRLWSVARTGDQIRDFKGKTIDVDQPGLIAYWVFIAASTDQEYTVTVRDNLTGTEATYSNPLGTASPAVTDVTALPVCLGP
ncbi:MAG TPA: hypothetical protein VMV46_06150 [Thermoanaerobaculia bacterium]|nr:hypothetical protein [Thermoanaerobaculia bacterium]